MTKYESSVKHIAAPVERVYGKLSDLTNLETLRTAASNPAQREMIMQQLGGRVTPEQMEQIAQQVENMQLTTDTLTTDLPMVGNVTLRVVERECSKLVKFEVEGAPMQANLWVQLLPEGEGRCAMKLTLGAELNFLMKQMVGSKLKDGVEKFADMLASVPY